MSREVAIKILEDLCTNEDVSRWAVRIIRKAIRELEDPDRAPDCL